MQAVHCLSRRRAPLSVHLPAPTAAWLPAAASPGPGPGHLRAGRQRPWKVSSKPVCWWQSARAHLGTDLGMLSPVRAAVSCPEVSIRGRFPIPLPSSDCCCGSEPLQRSRFTSHKSVWRRKGSGGVPGEGRERCLSLPLPQTLSHRPGQAAAGLPAVTWPLASPSTRPVWLERCPKWIKEPPRENKPAAIPQPTSRQWGVHRTGLPDEAQGPWTSSWGPGKMGAQWLFRDQS